MKIAHARVLIKVCPLIEKWLIANQRARKYTLAVKILFASIVIMLDSFNNIICMEGFLSLRHLECRLYLFVEVIGYCAHL